MHSYGHHDPGLRLPCLTHPNALDCTGVVICSSGQPALGSTITKRETTQAVKKHPLHVLRRHIRLAQILRLHTYTQLLFNALRPWRLHVTALCSSTKLLLRTTWSKMHVKRGTPPRARLWVWLHRYARVWVHTTYNCRSLSLFILSGDEVIKHCTSCKVGANKQTVYVIGYLSWLSRALRTSRNNYVEGYNQTPPNYFQYSAAKVYAVYLSGSWVRTISIDSSSYHRAGVPCSCAVCLTNLE